MRQSRKVGLVVAAASWVAALVVALPKFESDIAGAQETSTRQGQGPLDCGSNRAGLRAAFDEFTAILRGGDESAVREVLIEGPRFAWIWAGNNDDRDTPLFSADRPKQAARKVAAQGGLPVEITDFPKQMGNPNSRYAFSGGIRGTWGPYEFRGKSEINCLSGRARVLSLGVDTAD